MAATHLFDAYFRRADTDRDGRISGQEAVTFFQGANLSRDVLAKIWQYADQGQTGFLSRQEFYNALKLVTVAQTGRELTPAIVRGALQGPASSQIPPPQIQFPSGPAQSPQVGPTTTHLPQQFQNSAPSQSRSLNVQNSANITGNSTMWANPATSTSVTNPNIQAKAQNGAPPFPQANLNATKVSTLGSKDNSSVARTTPTTTAEIDLFGGDTFTVTQGKPPANVPAPSASTTTSGINLSGSQQHLKGQNAPKPIDLTNFALAPTSVLQATPSSQIQSTATTTDMTRTWPKITDSVVRRYAKIFFDVDTDKDGKITGLQARDLFLSWKIPREVLKQIWDLSDQDHDSMLSLREFCVALHIMERYRDGLKLPQVLPSSNCFEDSGVQALRIVEAQMAAPLNSRAPSWQASAGAAQYSVQTPGLPPRGSTAHPELNRAPSVSTRPAIPVTSKVDASGPRQSTEPPKSKAPQLEMDLVKQLSSDDQLTLQTKHQEAVDAEKKVMELEKEIMDAKEKMDFYRVKLQEIVLFKTRCDNRLNEITERTAAEKREIENLAKRYDLKLKQSGASQSQLLTNEATFRDIQERRLEVYSSIIRMEQGGEGNASLQSHADKMQNDLDELRKALNGKCKQVGLQIKPTTVVDLPNGWKPGDLKSAAAWDEDWDKFQDEGFTYVKDFMEEGVDAVNQRSTSNWDHANNVEDDNDKETSTEEVSFKENTASDTESDNGVVVNGNGGQHEDSSPEHPDLSDFNDKIADNDDHNYVEADKHTEDDGDWESVFSHKAEHLGFETSWSTNDNTTSKVPTQSNGASLAFNFDDPFDMPSSRETELTSKQSADYYNFNDPFDFSHSKDAQDDLPSFQPIRTKETSSFFDNSVPSTPLTTGTSSFFDSSVPKGTSSFFDSSVPKGTSSFFDSSVPSTPLTKGTSSFFDSSVPGTPLYGNTSSGGSFFDNPAPSNDVFARFDSFRSTTNEQPNSFARFDSFSTNQNVESGHDFKSFDENDPFSSSGPFGSKQNTTWRSFS